ncbi:MAG: metal-sulfur cluster assembly factor [Acidobacteria bacterium]|nr:metal-sulfur cluster assembly factor [Acidobacteriota bacterium]
MVAITEDAVREALREVIDPELGINIVDLGLVYGIEIDGARVCVNMTMTSPACPLGGYLKDLVDSTLKWRVGGVEEVDINLVWDPPWDPDRMSEAATRQLNGGR